MLFFNQSPEGIELIMEDIALWKTFFAPAIEAYMNNDFNALGETIERYNEFITKPGLRTIE